MKKKWINVWTKSIGFLLILLLPATLFAQTYDSGSTGADGAFSPIADITLAVPPDGIFNFTTVNVPAGVTVDFTPNIANTSVTLLATGDVLVDGVMSVNGEDGHGPIGGAIFNPGGAGGPGGFRGGHGGAKGAPITFGGAGHGPAGGGATSRGGYGAPAGFNTLIPLFGGSGGGGAFSTSTNAGFSGGGGGGATVIASSTRITMNGSITANGGNGTNAGSLFCTSFQAGGGGAGAIRLVSAEIAGSGSLVAVKGSFGCGGGSEGGLIRLEAFNIAYTGVVNTGPVGTNLFTSFSPGPVTAASTPPLINLPTLTISTVGGIPTSANPTGSFTAADISLPLGTTNPVPVSLTATHTPVGTVFTVRLHPLPPSVRVDVDSSPSTGVFSNSTTTAQVNFTAGQVSVLSAFANFTLPAQTASLFPLIDGEPVERVMLAANIGQPSTLTLVTKSGKEVPAKEVMDEKQLALLWKEVMIQK